MAKAKVLVTDLSGSYNRIFHYGDIVDESCFPPGNFSKLVDSKHIGIEEIADEPAAEQESNPESTSELKTSEGDGEQKEGIEMTADGNEHTTELNSPESTETEAKGKGKGKK